MDRRLLSLTVAVLATVGVIAGPEVASAATPDDTGSTGSIAVAVRDPYGQPLRLAGVRVTATDGEHAPTSATTDAAGAVTLTGLEAGSGYAITTTSPYLGVNTYAPATRTGVTVASGAVTRQTLSLFPGATAQGHVVGPDGAPVAGAAIATKQQVTDGFWTATTSRADGSYTLVGLPSGRYEITARLGTDPTGRTWKTRVAAQSSLGTATHVHLSTRLLHSSYDAVIGLRTPWTRIPTGRWMIAGATVRAIDTATSSTTTEVTSEIMDARQDVQFDLPSGTYQFEVVTTGIELAATEDLWFTSAGTLTADRSLAGSFPIRYDGHVPAVLTAEVTAP